MRVYISWSGQAGREAAEAIKQWLPNVIPNIQTFLMGHNLTPGTLWYQTILIELAQADACIICVTPQEITSPWINFIVGVLASKGDKVLYPLVLTEQLPQTIDGPLRMYHLALPNMHDVRQIVNDLGNRANPQLRPSFLEGIFSQQWHFIEPKLRKSMQNSEALASKYDNSNNTTKGSNEYGLSEEAKHLVTQAAIDPNGRIISIATLGGRHIQTGGKNFIERGNPRSEALWLSALRELSRLSLVEPLGPKEEVYALTSRGYEYADKLRNLA